ncbi:MAG: GspE/PulE family protein [Pseudomonadota bacterium]
MKPADALSVVNALVRDGLLTPHEQHAVLEIGKQTGGGLHTALRRLGSVDPDLLARTYQRVCSYEFLDLDVSQADTTAFNHVDLSTLRELGAIPLGVDQQGRCTVASPTPDDLEHRDAVQALVPSKRLRWAQCEAPALERAFARLRPPYDQLHHMIESGVDDAVALVDRLLYAAITQRASDIHVHPEQGFARLRLRIDGVLETAGVITQSFNAAVSVRLKVLAELDIADARAVQDGRFSQTICGEEQRFRVSVLPTDNGESIVVRVLSADRSATPLDELGLDPDSLTALRNAAAVQDGLLLIVGPTGSGKTTTLHALLELLRGPGRNVMTLEDPVEYTAPWLRQTSINTRHGIDYCDGVRAALRQDPDALLIGEIRDAESAHMAWRAAMTGHRVLSTVHATGALAAIPRLRDLGIGSPLLASQLVAIAGQRLMRRLCPDCAPRGAPPYTESNGCETCSGRGYLGRFPLVEVLTCDLRVRNAVAAERPLADLAAETGFVTLAEHAWRAVQRGITTVAEYQRVIGPAPEGWTDA